MMGAVPPPISTLDRKLAWARLSSAMFGEGAPAVEIDGYRVRDVLGRGAMGTVYLADDPTLEREVAIKLVDGGERATTLQEARALARLAHPGVVTVHHVGDVDGHVYIVMERLRGPDLRAWQAGRGWPEVVRMYIELARALDHAHRYAIVHRDFKPENVRVDEDGRGRIVDFGLAAAPNAAASGGTPAYLAPEQLGGASADPRMDQFAWAVALSEALTGTRATVNSLPGWPTGADAPPSRIAAVLARALQAEPDERWPSLDAAADALARASTTDAMLRGRELLLERLEATWLSAVLHPLRDQRVQIRPTLACASGPCELADVDRALAHAALVLVRGGLGAGKTTALLELAERALARARRDASALLPVVLNLSSWSTWPGDSLGAWLIDALSIEYGIPSTIARRWLDDEALLLLLDGLDELSPARRSACVLAIAALRAERLIGIAVACRSDDAAELEAALRPTLTVELQPLTRDEAHAVFAQQGRVELAAALDRATAPATWLRSPLLVDMTLRCVDDVPELADEHDGDALLRVIVRRVIDRQLGPLAPETRTWLRRLAGLMTQQGVSELWLERMQPSWLAQPWQRVVHGLACVMVAAALLGLVVGVTLIPTAGLRVGLGSAVLAALVLAAFVGLASGLGRIEPVERLRWSWARAWAQRRRAFVQALVLAAIVSSIAAAMWGRGQAPAFVLAIALSNLVGYVLLFTLMLGLLGGLAPALVAVRSRVNAGMRASGRNMLVVWLLVASLLAVPLLGLSLVAEAAAVPDIDGEAIELWRAAPRRFFALVGLCAASTLGCVAGLLRGGFALIQHAVLRALLALSGQLPLRLGSLLERGCAAGLLRRVGGGHTFVHGAVQAELALEVD